MSDREIGARGKIYQSQPFGLIYRMDVDLTDYRHDMVKLRELSTMDLFGMDMLEFLFDSVGVDDQPYDHYKLFITVEGEDLSVRDGDKKIRRLKRTSEGYLIHRIPNWFPVCLNDFIDFLLENEGDTEYKSFFFESTSTTVVVRMGVVVVVPPRRYGGCKFVSTKKPLPKEISKFLYCPSTSNYMCFWDCVLKYVGDIYDMNDMIELKDRYSAFDVVRVDQAARVLEVEGYEYIIYGLNEIFYELASNVTAPTQLTVQLLLYKNHYYLIDNDKVLQKKKCSGCFKYLQATNLKHFESCKSCLVCKKRMGPGHICTFSKPRAPEGSNVLKRNKRIKTNAFVSLSGMYFADFETLTDPSGRMVVYSAAICPVEVVEKYGEGVDVGRVECRRFLGEDALESFMRFVEPLEGTLCFYNGSRFDFFFILEWLVHHRVELDTLVRDDKSNRLVRLGFWKLKLWDLCLFTMASLAQTCKDLKVPTQYVKKNFDHDKIKSYADVRLHSDEIVEYNSYDVICLGIAFINFATAVWNLYKFNVTEASTLSQMAYEIWRTHWITEEERKMIMLPTTDEYQYIRRALYGGRCMPQAKWFISEELDKDFADIEDYLIYLDVSSLYPSASVLGKFPLGNCDWATDNQLRMIEVELARCGGEEDMYTVMRSYCEVDVVCPKNLLTPFLMARNHRGQLIQDLYDKYHQVYDGITMVEAVRLGYVFTKIHRALVYQALGNPIQAYMVNAYENKSNSSKDSVDYAIHKYMMNGLTGKFNQILIGHDWFVKYDDAFMLQNPDVVKMEWVFSDTQSDYLGMMVALANDNTPNKPLAFGVNILSMSRVLMSKYTSFIGGYHRISNFSFYGDTDSMIIHKRAHAEALDKDGSENVFGNKLGLLVDELAGSKIIRAIFLQPKTYILEVLKPSGQLEWIVRAKGIPKSEKIINVRTYMDEMDADVDDESASLTEVIYYLVSPDGQVLQSRRCLNWHYFESMVLRDCKVLVHFGSLKRRVVDQTRGNMPATVELILKQERTINGVEWWEAGKRIILEEGELSVPDGYVL